MTDTVASPGKAKNKLRKGEPVSYAEKVEKKPAADKSGPKKGRGRPKSDKIMVPHPTYRSMIVDAIKQLNERKGSSTFAIKKCIHGNYDFEIVHRYYAEAIKVLLEGDKIKYNKENGKGSNLLKLVVKDKPAVKKPAEKKAAKKPAEKKAAKKPAEKKAAKKPAAKKVAKKPVAKKVAKKPAAKKALKQPATKKTAKTPSKKVAKKTAKK